MDRLLPREHGKQHRVFRRSSRTRHLVYCHLLPDMSTTKANTYIVLRTPYYLLLPTHYMVGRASMEYGLRLGQRCPVI